MATIGRRAYAEIFGPTVGDRVRLADTGLLIEVEKDFTLAAGSYGEEVKFGGGKTIRDGMAQSQRTNAQGAVDCVMTNALIMDHWGIVKADIGLKGGRIVAIGKAGNPDTQPGVDIIIGPGTEVISCEGNIVTAGGFTQESGNQALAEGWADAIAFGVPFLANPDLPERFRRHAPLNPADESTFYAPGAKGYTDYPALAG